MIQEPSEDELGFHHREVIPDAYARPRAEGDPRELVACCFLLGQEPIRVECLRVGPKLLLSMNRICGDDDGCVFRNASTAELRVLVRLSREHENGGIQPKGLFEHTKSERQPRKIGDRRRGPDGIDFRRPLKTSQPLEQAFAAIRAKVARRREDRVFGPDIEAVRALIEAGTLSPLVGPLL